MYPLRLMRSRQSTGGPGSAGSGGAVWAAGRSGLIARLLKQLNLRFPTLFVILATLTVADFLVPDFIPFVDELILASLTLVVGLWRDRRTVAPPEPARESR